MVRVETNNPRVVLTESTLRELQQALSEFKEDFRQGKRVDNHIMIKSRGSKVEFELIADVYKQQEPTHFRRVN